MNYSNIVVFFAAFTTSCIFFGSVFVNLQIKNSKVEVIELYEKVDSLKNDIKRQKIEIAALTNPALVLKYIEENGLKPVPLKDITVMKIKKEKAKEDR